MSEVTRIEGLAEFRRAVRALPDGPGGGVAVRAVTKAMKDSMDPIAREAKGYTTGQIAKAIKPFSRGLNAGIRSAHPGARVHEFADRPFQRRSPNGGTHTVRWNDPTPTPRYAYRAAEEEMPEVEDRVLEAIAKVARDTGWL